MGALLYNSHFATFVAKNHVFTKESAVWLANVSSFFIVCFCNLFFVSFVVCKVFGKNNSIEDFIVPNGQLGKEAQSLFDQLAKNRRSALLRLDVANNNIDDKVRQTDYQPQYSFNCLEIF